MMGVTTLEVFISFLKITGRHKKNIFSLCYDDDITNIKQTYLFATRGKREEDNIKKTI